MNTDNDKCFRADSVSTDMHHLTLMLAQTFPSHFQQYCYEWKKMGSDHFLRRHLVVGHLLNQPRIPAFHPMMDKSCTHVHVPRDAHLQWLRRAEPEFLIFLSLGYGCTLSVHFKEDPCAMCSSTRLQPRAKVSVLDMERERLRWGSFLHSLSSSTSPILSWDSQ